MSQNYSRHHFGHIIAAIALLLLLVLAPIAAAAPLAEPCPTEDGFAALHDLIPDQVGDCTGDLQVADNGDAQQPTTHGLLVYRQADDQTVFTDGTTTWVNGPCGLQSRPNDQLFVWEQGGSCEPAAAPTSAPAPSSLAPAPTAAPTIPAGATAVCGDGTYSFSQHRSGTCSRHGGVAQWVNPPAS